MKNYILTKIIRITLLYFTMWFYSKSLLCQSSNKHEFILQISTPVKHQGLYKYFNDEWLLNPSGIQPDPDRRRNFKYGLNIMYFLTINDKLKVGIKAGIGNRNINEYYRSYSEGINPFSGVHEVSELTQEIKYHQLNWHIEPMLNFYQQFKRMEFNFGIGPSYYRIGKGYQDYNEFSSYQEQSFWSLDVKIKTKIGGGHSFGINAYSSINYNITNSFSIGFQIDSYMHYIICKEKTSYTWTQDSNNYSNTTPGESNGLGEEKNDFQQFSIADLVPCLSLIYKPKNKYR